MIGVTPDINVEYGYDVYLIPVEHALAYIRKGEDWE